MNADFDVDASARLIAHCVGIISAPGVTVGQLTAAADDLANECGALLAEVKRLRAEVDALRIFLAMLDNPRPIADKSDPDITHFRSVLIGYVVTSFARQLIEMSPEHAPNCISVIATPSSEDHDLAGYRMEIAVARPGKLLPSEQRDEARLEAATFATCNGPKDSR